LSPTLLLGAVIKGPTAKRLRLAVTSSTCLE